MGRGDFKNRGVSVPFTAHNFIGEAWTLPNIMRPTELYVRVRLVAPDDQDLKFRLAIAGFGNNYTPKTKADYSELEITQSHQLITGQTAKLECAAGEELFLDGLPLIKAMPKDGHADFKKDAFVLLFVYDTEPNFDTTGSIDVIVNGSALLGVK